MSQPEPSMTSEAWITLAAASSYYDRPERTLYKWLKDGEVRKLRPLHETWLYRPDVERMDQKTQRRKKRS
ncbi:hypothetical protein MUN77_01765 [Leucobacter allii]|uniref:hypothetical protein n=1 Tax=Leucobacter allii TaxID=2932247 RepID=UPI001FD2D6F4|nr:hypothetical protein [Leucobacter allii]UOR02086.1 hypothetical protein MUN77_01765 [Leucobacter allii]